MSDIVFAERSKQPTDVDLAEILGAAKGAWDLLSGELDGQEGVTVEWKFYGKKHGWQRKATKKRRAVLYMIPHEGQFTAGMALNDRACAMLPDAGLPAEFVREIETAKAYPEGRPATLIVTGPAQIEVLRALLELKLASL